MPFSSSCLLLSIGCSLCKAAGEVYSSLSLLLELSISFLKKLLIFPCLVYQLVIGMVETWVTVLGLIWSRSSSLLDSRAKAYLFNIIIFLGTKRRCCVNIKKIRIVCRPAPEEQSSPPPPPVLEGKSSFACIFV